MKSLFEQFGGIYRKESDYAVPNLETPDAGNFEIGIYGQLTSGKLNEHLVEIDSQAQERVFRIVEKMKQAQGITEQLKENNPIKRTRIMNCVRQQAEEIVLKEMIYN